MLFIPNKNIAAETQYILNVLQQGVDASGDYPEKVATAKELWQSKTSSRAKSDAFKNIRATLASMCVGEVRCAYCEDSLADEVEHIQPKSLFPEATFSWVNYLYSCGPCNGPKGNRYGTLDGTNVVEFVRKRSDPILPPPAGASALVNPRLEDPLDFFELDLGGTTPTGAQVQGTFVIMPADAANEEMKARAVFTIDVLGLNREVIRLARKNAYGGYRARLIEYVKKKEEMADEAELEALREDILMTPHLTVFAEMRRQRDWLPELAALFDAAPEINAWRLTPTT